MYIVFSVRRACGGLGDAEVDDFGQRLIILRADQHVAGFEVAVDQPFLVGVLNGVADLDEQFQPGADIKLFLSQYSVMGIPRTSSMTKYGQAGIG